MEICGSFKGFSFIYLYNNNNNKTTSFKEKDEIHSHGCVWACEESMGDVKLHSQLVVV